MCIAINVKPLYQLIGLHNAACLCASSHCLMLGYTTYMMLCVPLLHAAQCNRDASPVVPSQRAKSISDEDSYKRGTITQQQQVQQQLERLTAAVLQRVAQRLQQHSEAATTLRLGVRQRAADRKTRQCRLPLQLLLLATGTAEQQRAAVAGVQTLLWGLFDKLSMRAPYDISLISVGFADFQHAVVRQQSSSASASSSDGTAGGGFATSTQSAMSKFLCKSPAPDSTTAGSNGSSGTSIAATATDIGATASAAKTQRNTTAAATATTAEAAAASQERWDERMTIVTIAATCVRHCRDCGARVAVDDLQAHAQWHNGA
jgi:impB/mucB/samB family C-terminal domain